MEIEEKITSVLASAVFTLLVRPLVAMIGWSVFLETSKLNLPAFGYWEFFMLNLVCGLFRSDLAGSWKVKQK